MSCTRNPGHTIFIYRKIPSMYKPPPPQKNKPPGVIFGIIKFKRNVERRESVFYQLYNVVLTVVSTLLKIKK